MGYPRITLFEDVNFNGKCQGFVDSFPTLGYRRVCPRSAIVEDGAWTIYSNLGFQGIVYRARLVSN